MAEDESGSKSARAVGQKGLGADQETSWLVEDMCTQLRVWRHTGGAVGELIMKSDNEPAMLALRDAVMKYHGGRVIKNNPPRENKR